MHVPQTSPIKSNSTPAYAKDRGVADYVDRLVVEAKAGSNAAFDQLCVLYRARVLRTLHTITDRREDAEDALQNAFLSAYLSLQSFEGRSSFGSWFTRIAVNSALQQLRRRKRRPEQPLMKAQDDSEPVAIYDPVDPAPDPEEACRRQQSRAQLQDAISRLPIKLREILELYLDEDLPRNEIGKRLAITEAAAKSRLYRAKVRLMDRMAKTNSDALRTGKQNIRIA